MLYGQMNSILGIWLVSLGYNGQ